jgi:L-seryl-tRNA(Ser) seleniumtransferase
MKRAMRCDKLTIAALDAVLRLYENPELLAQRIPALRLLTRPAAEIEAQAGRLQPVLAHWLRSQCAQVGSAAVVSVVPVQSQIGSGSLLVDLPPSFALRLGPSGKHASGRALLQFAQALRKLPVPVIGRIANCALLLDLRCLDGADEASLCRQLGGTPP